MHKKIMKSLSKLPKHYWLVIGIALLVAFINARLGFDSLLQCAIPWAIIAFAIAFFVSSRGNALRLSGIFGFVVSYAFLWFDNRAIKSVMQVLILIPLIILPALFGLLCGLLCGYLGWRVKQVFSK